MIQVSDLCIGYPQKRDQKPLISGINFEIPKGQLVCLLGVNGSGKSTLLKSIGRHIDVLQGRIAIHGKAIESYSPRDFAQQVSWVHNERNLSNMLLVKDLVRLGRQPYSNWLDQETESDRDFVAKAIEMTGIAHLRERRCVSLSDGQLQLVLIARAIAQDTPVILLDEPTTHLDLHQSIRILKLLQQLSHEHGKTILFSSHQVESCLQLCDAAVSIYENEVIFQPIKTLIESTLLSKIFASPYLHFNKKTLKFDIL